MKQNIHKLTTSQTWNDKQQIHCPQCQFEYVHPMFDYVDVTLSNDDYSASKEVRGSVITIPMYCESGHYFETKIGFCKGSTFVWTEENGSKIGDTMGDDYVKAIDILTDR